MAKPEEGSKGAKDVSNIMSLMEGTDHDSRSESGEQSENVFSDDDVEGDELEEENLQAMRQQTKSSFVDKFKNSDSEDDFGMSDNDERESELDKDDEDENKSFDEATEVFDRVHTVGREKSGKLKKLTPEQLEKERKKIKKTGVCYLTSIPPYMKPTKLRSVLSRFGKIDRLFLKPEDSTQYKKRVKYGGNKKKKFTEGWVEFTKKREAKLCAATLNGNKLGGKKTSYYYDDVINIKYLKGFKWHDLTQQIATENEVRQAKLTLELSHQQKMNKNFVNNVEQSKMISQIQKKRSQKNPDKKSDDPEIRRNFKQRKVKSSRADADDNLKESLRPDETLKGVLSQVF